MATKQKTGKHKRYGPKMANPRIKKSKEKRQCGPLGYAVRMRMVDKRFTSRRLCLVYGVGLKNGVLH